MNKSGSVNFSETISEILRQILSAFLLSAKKQQINKSMADPANSCEFTLICLDFLEFYLFSRFLENALRTDRWTDGRADGRTDKRTDGWTEGQTGGRTESILYNCFAQLKMRFDVAR